MKTALLIVLQLAASGSDAYFTHRNLEHGREDNPIVRPFVGNTSKQVIYFSSMAAMKIVIPHLVRKKHSRMADVMAVAGIADNTEAAAWSATH